MERTIPVDPILEKGYNVRLLVDDFDGLISRWSDRSEKFRQNVDSALNCQYGDGEKDKLDIFRCGEANAPLFIFVHGGYWQRGDKSVYSFVAESFINSGIDVALIGYQLCPSASMTNIVEKIQEYRKSPCQTRITVARWMKSGRHQPATLKTTKTCLETFYDV